MTFHLKDTGRDRDFPESIKREASPLLEEEVIEKCLEKYNADSVKCDFVELLSCIRCNNMEKLSAIIGKL